jgi:hypothetical protein
VTGTDPAREGVSRWARRSGELGVRIRDLHERNAQLSAGFGPPDLAEHRAVGSTPDQAAKAQALARTASLRALEALQRMASMRVHAASAHDRAARLHELLAKAGDGDVSEHRERAETHRRQAREDRAAADRIFRSQYVKPVESGHS